MEWLEVLTLAVIQGLTEFLPVSSSGHLVIADALWFSTADAGDRRLAVNVILHAGTLLAVLVVFRRRILALLGKDRRVIALLAVGSLPAAVAGLLVDQLAPAVVQSPVVAGAMLLVTAAVLWFGGGEAVGSDCREMSYRQALLIGLAQAAAILPGLSRSGTTIVAGLRTGLSREAAAAFSFLLAIPAIGGAALLQACRLAEAAPSSSGTSRLIAGAATAFVVGWFALTWLLNWLRQGRLRYFAWWCLIVGVAVLSWQAALLA